MYVGFVLDDLPDYLNLSNSLPNLYFQLITFQGKFDHTGVTFDSTVNDRLIIKVQASST